MTASWDPDNGWNTSDGQRPVDPPNYDPENNPSGNTERMKTWREHVIFRFSDEEFRLGVADGIVRKFLIHDAGRERTDPYRLTWGYNGQKVLLEWTCVIEYIS